MLDKLRLSFEQIKLLAIAITKSANMLKSHVDTLARNEQRAKELKYNAAVQQVAQVVKAKGKAAAVQVRALEAAASPIFLFDLVALRTQ